MWPSPSTVKGAKVTGRDGTLRGHACPPRLLRNYHRKSTRNEDFSFFPISSRRRTAAA